MQSAQVKSPRDKQVMTFRKMLVSSLWLVPALLLIPVAAHAQGTPLDIGFTALQNLFTHGR
jgi:hypothetical protein